MPFEEVTIGSARLIRADCREALSALPAGSVHCCVTSPPYFGLRDYGVADQIGLEPTPASYIANLVEIMRGVRRVLRADGTLWLNIGDTYAGSHETGRRDAQQRRVIDGRAVGRKAAEIRQRMAGTPHKHGGVKAKDLIGIPWMLAFALRDDGWYLRRDIIWHKPNPMPESVTDRPTSAHEYLFLLTKSARYYYDSEAIKEPVAASTASDARIGKPIFRDIALAEKRLGKLPGSRRNAPNAYGDTLGRNKRSVWTVATAPFKGAHFATFPPALVEPCILAGTSERGVCPKCGAQWEREIKKSIGWHPTCACGAGAVPATVIDPFAGASTTALVADRLGRRSVSIELSAAYHDIACARISAAAHDAPVLATG